jgi:hypothetical protein
VKDLLFAGANGIADRGKKQVLPVGQDDKVVVGQAMMG